MGCKGKARQKLVLIRLGLRMSGLRQFPNCTAQDLSLVRRRWAEGSHKGLPNCTTESRSSLVPPISLPFHTTAKCAIFRATKSMTWSCQGARPPNQTNWNIFMGENYDCCLFYSIFTFSVSTKFTIWLFVEKHLKRWCFPFFIWLESKEGKTSPSECLQQLHFLPHIWSERT